ncbi:MAG: HAMP domain-containing protein [Planctomycetes bacterium]|nr:HAMP domain-containing protein [Planctomycetota bacterium]
MGPFNDYGLNAVEDSVQGWVRLASQQVNAAPDLAQAILSISKEFPYAVTRQESTNLPKFATDRFRAGREVVFYPLDANRWCASTKLSNTGDYLQFGPFPAFVKVEQPAATTTLAVVLLPAALAIAMLLRPVAKQLRQLESAAQAIAGGDLGARVDEKHIGSAQPLAAAFNQMAARTETMLRTQRELLQAVSHELKTPLARLRFAMGLVEFAGTESQRQERLQSMDDAVEDLNQLVEELVGYIRTESLELTPNKESIDAIDAIQSAIGRAKEISPGIEFRFERAEGSDDLTIHADRNAFQRAIGNLLSNAGRFARRRVFVRVVPSPDRIGSWQRRPSVLVEVEDDGPGIPVEDRKRVFEPFVRLNIETNDEKDRLRGAGVGLGLALVHRILEQHGGAVEVAEGCDGGCVIRTYWEPGH